MQPVINGYDSFAQIGQGGFSTVWRARQTAYDRTVAVKVLNNGPEDDATRRRFTRECALAGRLTGHPNIVTVLDSGFLPDGHPYIAMEYCSAGSAADRLQKSGPFPADEALRLGVKIAGALHTAHQRGVIHRDVKPANILYTDFGEPALTDFGISTNLASEQTATVAYTPTHAAPEVLQGQKADARTDIYTLASTLYQLLAGHSAFAATERSGLAPFVISVTTQPPPPLPDSVPQPLRDAILAAMAKNPAERAPTAEAFGHVLQEVQRQLGLPVTEMVISSGTAAPEDALDTQPLAAPPAPPASSPTPPQAPTPPAPPASGPVAPPPPPPMAPMPAAGAATILPPVAPNAAAAAAAGLVGGETVLAQRHEPGPDLPQAPRKKGAKKGLLIALAVIAVVAALGIGGTFAVGAFKDGRLALPAFPGGGSTPSETPVVTPEPSASFPTLDPTVTPSAPVAPATSAAPAPATTKPKPAKTSTQPSASATASGKASPTGISTKIRRPIPVRTSLIQRPTLAVPAVKELYLNRTGANHFVVAWRDAAEPVAWYMILVSSGGPEYTPTLDVIPRTGMGNTCEPLGLDHCFEIGPFESSGQTCVRIMSSPTKDFTRTSTSERACA